MSEEALQRIVRAAVADAIAPLQREVTALRSHMGERLVSQREAAERRAVTQRTIRNWEAEGKLRRVNADGQPRYLLSDVVAVKP